MAVRDNIASAESSISECGDGIVLLHRREHGYRGFSSTTGILVTPFLGVDLLVTAAAVARWEPPPRARPAKAAVANGYETRISKGIATG